MKFEQKYSSNKLRETKSKLKRKHQKHGYTVLINYYKNVSFLFPHWTYILALYIFLIITEANELVEENCLCGQRNIVSKSPVRASHVYKNKVQNSFSSVMCTFDHILTSCF